MRRADAPPPGWYPDPTGASGLLWWDGLDWTRHHRPPPAHLDDGGLGGQAGDRADGTMAGDGTGMPTATQLRSRTAERAARRTADRLNEQQLAATVAEARRVAQTEVERAVKDATSQLAATRDRYLPRLDDMRRRLRRWTRIVVVVVLVLVALSTWANATLQVGLLEWLGDRIDSFTALVAVALSWPPG